MKLVWDKAGEHFYETGVDHAVLYPQDSGTYPKGYAWNGITNVSESPSGADENALYADNIKYLALRGTEDYGGTIQAYTYPDEWAECDGSATIAKGAIIGQQTRKSFGLCYRTLLGNDVQGNDHGYKLHLIYGATASPSERSYATVNDSPEAIEFSWEYTTVPVSITGHKPAACLTVDSTKANSTKLKALEDILYGGESTEARLPLPDEIVTILGDK